MKHAAIRSTAAWLSLMLAVSQGCATQALWETHDPHERVWIAADQITAEELDRRGLAYDPYEVDGDVKGFFVEKSAVHALGDYTVRVLATPVTVALDVAGSVVVVALLALGQGGSASFPQGRPIFVGHK